MTNIIEFIRQHQLQSVLDIGANIGNWAVAIRSQIPRLRMLSIEANPFCEPFLKQKQLNYRMCCLSDQVKTVNFFIDLNSVVSTGSSYYLEQTQHFNRGNALPLTTNTLDAIVSEDFDYIKIDTQGSELDIIRGGLRVVKKCRYLQIEMSLVEYNQGSPLCPEVAGFLEGIHFKPVLQVENHYDGKQCVQQDIIFENTTVWT